MKRIETILVFILIILQTAFLFWAFSFIKKGYHSDEIWNYAFANSFETKELYASNSGESLMNQWRDSDNFLKYISVEPEHRFEYGQVIKNTSMDQNPPLQYMILHTICSFFPGKFSRYFCFSINIFSFVISQIYLYLLSKKISNNTIVGFATVFLYGFGAGAMDITLFLRIYALAVMFIVIFAYYSHLIYEDSKENKLKIKNLLGMGISCFLGAYTLHLFLLIAFIITVFYIIFYLFTKRFKTLFIHGFVCLGGALLSIAAYPSIYQHLSGPKESHNYSLIKFPTPMQNRFYFYYLTKDLFGLHVDPFPNPYLEWFLIGLVCVIFLVTPFCFVFHKEEWFKKMESSIKCRLTDIGKKAKNISISLIAYLTATISMVLVAGDRTSIYLMTVYANRYLFIVYPLAVVFAVCTVYFIISLTSNKTKVATVITCCICFAFAVWTHLIPANWRYFQLETEEGKSCESFENNANTIIVVNSDWLITVFAPKLYNTNSYYALNFRDTVAEDLFESVDTKTPCYLILDQTAILDDSVDYEAVKDDPVVSDWYGVMKHEDDYLSQYLALKEVGEINRVGTERIMNKDFGIYEVKFE